MCTIVPMHTLDSLFEKCPNCSIRVLLLIWLWGRVTPPREIAFCSHCLFFFIPLIIVDYFLLFSSFFSFVFSFFRFGWAVYLFELLLYFLWYGFGMGRLFFFSCCFFFLLLLFFSKLVVTFFVYCYGIVIVLNFLLIRPRSHYWTFFVFFERKICQLVAYKLSATPILKPCQI